MIARGEHRSLRRAASRHPRSIETANNACFIVRDSTGQALGYFYFEEEPGQRLSVSESMGRPVKQLELSC